MKVFEAQHLHFDLPLAIGQIGKTEYAAFIRRHTDALVALGGRDCNAGNGKTAKIDLSGID